MNELSAVGAVAPEALTETRLQLHWAAQVVAAVGHSQIPERPDYSHAAFSWDSEQQMLVSEIVESAKPWRVGIDLAATKLRLFVDGEAVGALSFEGETLEGAQGWLTKTLEEALGAELAKALERPPHLPPEHPAGSGAPIVGINLVHSAELTRWYALAAQAIEKAVAGRDGASSLRCWPHHFDLASLITLDPEADAEEARSVGVGMSPGDEGYAEPYFYVNPWPYPEAPTLPELPHGHWHTEGWTGAVLTASALLNAAGDGSDKQTTVLEEFLEAAIAADLALLSGD